MEYRVIETHSVGEMMDILNELAQRGWVLQGPVIPHLRGSQVTSFIATMCRSKVKE